MRLRSNLERSSSMNTVSRNQPLVGRCARLRGDLNEPKKYENPNAGWKKTDQPLTSSTLNASTLSTLSSMSRSSSINLGNKKPAFKLSTKIQYNDKNLYNNVSS